MSEAIEHRDRAHQAIGRGDEVAARTAPPAVALSPKLDAATELAARTFLVRIDRTYPVRHALVFGSRARGRHAVGSDADLAVVLKGRRCNRSKVAGDMAAIAFDVMLETGVLVDPLPLWDSEFARPSTFVNPKLIEHIRRDGVRL